MTYIYIQRRKRQQENANKEIGKTQKERNIQKKADL